MIYVSVLLLDYLFDHWGILFAGTIGSLLWSWVLYCCCFLQHHVLNGRLLYEKCCCILKISNFDLCCEFSYMRMKILRLWFEDEVDRNNTFVNLTFAMIGVLAWKVKKWIKYNTDHYSMVCVIFSRYGFVFVYCSTTNYNTDHKGFITRLDFLLRWQDKVPIITLYLTSIID